MRGMRCDRFLYSRVVGLIRGSLLKGLPASHCCFWDSKETATHVNESVCSPALRFSRFNRIIDLAYVCLLRATLSIMACRALSMRQSVVDLNRSLQDVSSPFYSKTCPSSTQLNGSHASTLYTLFVASKESSIAFTRTKAYHGVSDFVQVGCRPTAGECQEIAIIDSVGLGYRHRSIVPIRERARVNILLRSLMST